MMFPQNRQLVALALLASLAVTAGCSKSSGGSSQPTPIQGGSYQLYLPMQDGDRYECDTGLVLKIETASPAEVGQPGIVRLHIDDGRGGFGLYWSEDANRGTLMHGAFDTDSNRKILLDEPYPIYRLGGSPTLAGGEFDDLQSQTPVQTIALGVDITDPTSGLNSPAWYSGGSIYGLIYQHELDYTVWTLDFRGAAGRYPGEITLYSAPGFGPLSITVDGTPHRVVRAWVDGVRFEQ